MTSLVRDAMQSKVQTLEATASALAAAQRMRARRVGCLIVTTKREPVGIITERDLVYKVVAARKPAAQTPLARIMSKPLITIGPAATLQQAAELMRRHGIRRLGVRDRQQLVGIITATDLARKVSEEGFWAEFQQAMVRAGEYGSSPPIPG